MEPQETHRDIPEARYIDYAPPAAARKGMIWRGVVAVFSALCFAIGVGMAIACGLSRDSHDAAVFGALAGGFITAGVALPVMIYVMRRL